MEMQLVYLKLESQDPLDFQIKAKKAKTLYWLMLAMIIISVAFETVIIWIQHFKGENLESILDIFQYTSTCLSLIYDAYFIYIFSKNSFYFLRKKQLLLIEKKKIASSAEKKSINIYKIWIVSLIIMNIILLLGSPILRIYQEIEYH